MSDSGHPTAHRSRPWRRSPFTLVSWRWGISGRTWEGQKGSQGGPGAPVEAVGCVLCICLPQLVAPVTGLKCASDQHAEFHMAPCPQSHAICGWHGVPLSRPSAPPSLTLAFHSSTQSSFFIFWLAWPMAHAVPRALGPGTAPPPHGCMAPCSLLFLLGEL